MQSQPQDRAAGAAETTILVVDDDATLRTLLRACLERGAHRVVEASDGVEALRRFAEHRPALVLTDMMMPRMGGSELARRLRADPAARGTRIVAISGGPHGEEARAAGCDAFVAKPFSPQQLIDCVRGYLTPGADVPRRGVAHQPLAPAPVAASRHVPATAPSRPSGRLPGDTRGR